LSSNLSIILIDHESVLQVQRLLLYPHKIYFWFGKKSQIFAKKISEIIPLSKDASIVTRSG
jgi:hypothetical protein